MDELIEGLYTTEPPVSERDMFRVMLTRDENLSVEKLKAIGAPAVPYLVKALADPRTRDHYRKIGIFLDPASPFARICSLLDDLNPPEAAGVLATYLDHPVSGFRKQAALNLGSIAAHACIEPLTKALADPEKDVGVYAMIGIGHALDAGRGHPAFFSGIFPAVAQILNQHELMGHAPRLLLRIDQERAVPLLLAPACLTLENPNLDQVLKALNYTAHYPIPRELILPLLEKLEPLAGNYPQSYQFREALVAYANNPDAATEPKLRSLVNSPDKDIGAAAAEALTQMHHLGDIYQRVIKKDFLSPPEQLYRAVALYHADVNNGGHLQYLGNFSPLDYRLAIDGLKAMNAPARAAILQKALEVFGPSGPPEDRGRRRDIVYDELTDAQNDLLRDLDQRYYDGKENVELLLALYAVDHKEAFSAS